MLNKNQLPKEQQDLIERFLVAYNAIDLYLRNALRADKEHTFKSLVRGYYDHQPSWPYKDSLLVLADLRNVLTHSRTNLYQYLSVPTEVVVEEIEKIRESLENPEKVLPRFQKPVEVVDIEASLSNVLEKIHRWKYSQFPVYSNGIFKGLITENGITFWLASQVQDLALVDFDEQTAKNVLAYEEQRKNYLFIARDISLYKASSYFLQNNFLEALLITAQGKETEKLLGIITRWDTTG